MAETSVLHLIVYGLVIAGRLTLFSMLLGSRSLELFLLAMCSVPRSPRPGHAVVLCVPPGLVAEDQFPKVRCISQQVSRRLVDRAWGTLSASGLKFSL